ncbi:unnamed protein product [Leptidea sinapis]|uniref:Claspin n=1 Tax=Leptidea sinapis TaxID=189913 RepID=A0A5E4QWH9_9NEOP|nr:unnamed protein product [Leptidea sinapis]
MNTETKEALSDEESILDKIESQLEADNENAEEIDHESGEENDEYLVEDDIDMSEKPKKRNTMIDDEAEVSDNESELGNGNDEENANIEDAEIDEELKSGDESDGESSDESSCESEEEDDNKPRKGRILKAFEDSDDEKDENVSNNDLSNDLIEKDPYINDNLSQEDELIQLAQANKSISEDIFSTQDSTCTVVGLSKNNKETISAELGTFSILNVVPTCIEDMEYARLPDSMNIISETQPSDTNLDAIAGLCSGNFTDDLAPTQIENSQLTPSLEIGDDIAALCTGKFYDNPFVSQVDLSENGESAPKTDEVNTEAISELSLDKDLKCDKNDKANDILKGILDELDGPDFDTTKQNKYFLVESKNETVRKKFVIESDDETNDPGPADGKVKRKIRKRKLEERALQISDDEESGDEYESDIEDEADTDNKVYEYDSEENEVEVKQVPAKKKKMGEFFENEAELTSEDEWVGSGDEDEAGLDRMEREEGDDEIFHQGKLQRELGEIHMREVLDQDKREVRLIQELLFEDADLGDGHRQRRFKWRNIDGEEDTGAIVDEFGDSQEDEFESEEQWRKQRHEREMFLRKLHENDDKDDELTNAINRTAIIKANLSSRTMSNLISEPKPTEAAGKENSNVQKRKADPSESSPQVIKKIKTSNKYTLFDRLLKEI